MRRGIDRTLRAVGDAGIEPGDDADTRLAKRLMVSISLLVSAAAVVWGLVYLSVGEPGAAAIPLGYAAASLVSFAHLRVSKLWAVYRFSQLLLILVLPFVLMWVLGGFINASGVILWSFLAPLGAMMASGRRQALSWFAAFATLVVISGVIQPYTRESNDLSTDLIVFFFVMNILGVSFTAIGAIYYFVSQKDRALDLLAAEQERSERLLLNVLPSEIAAELKDTERRGTIAERYDSVSVLFADIVGFTPLSEELAPEAMVDLLDEVFSHFDVLVDQYGCEKIRTVGDNYMIAAGVPVRRADHASRLAAMALDMNAFIAGNGTTRPDLQFRIGINSGPVVAGVIGTRKFQYDLWGDTVNTASRMESHGIPGRIQIAPATYELVKGEFICQPRGVIDVKGKGEIETWFLEGART